MSNDNYDEAVFGMDDFPQRPIEEDGNQQEIEDLVHALLHARSKDNATFYLNAFLADKENRTEAIKIRVIGTLNDEITNPIFIGRESSSLTIRELERLIHQTYEEPSSSLCSPEIVVITSPDSKAAYTPPSL